MLLYVGALTDLRPVMRFAHAHRVFIYVDGLPTSKYFTASDRMSSVKEIQLAMISELERERAFLNIEEKADHFTIHTVGGQAIHYFHDTLDVQMFDNPRLATYLADVQALYMCGFFPKMIKPLPSLKRLIYTDGCSPYRSEHEGKLCFDWKSMEKLSLSYDYEDHDGTGSKDGGIIFELMGTCGQCGELTSEVETLWKASRDRRKQME